MRVELESSRLSAETFFFYNNDFYSDNLQNDLLRILVKNTRHELDRCQKRQQRTTWDYHKLIYHLLIYLIRIYPQETRGIENHLNRNLCGHSQLML